MLTQFSNGAVSHWGIGATEWDLADYLNVPNDFDRWDIADAVMALDLADFVDPFLDLTGEMPAAELIWEITPALSLAEDLTIDLLSLPSPPPRMEIDWDQLHATPEAVRSQITHNYVDCGLGASLVAFELARFITPPGSVGLITSCQTELTFEDNDVRWPRGDSAWHTRTLGTDIGGVNCWWALMVEPIHLVSASASLNAIWQLGSPASSIFRIATITPTSHWLKSIPGKPHPEMSPWNKMLFLFGNDHAVQWHCPENTMVSLWLYRQNETVDGLLACGGMLKGLTQIQKSPRTYENFTRMWS